MEQKVNLRIITIKDLWRILVRRRWILILAFVVGGASVYFINSLLYVPEYTSTATLYILRQTESEDSADTSNDFSLALKVVNDCTYLLKSHTVLDEVIKDLSLDISYEDLYDCVSTSNPEDTRILEVSVTAATPQEAKRIVDQLCKIGPKKIEMAMGFQQVNLYEYGTQDDEPSNKMPLMVCAMAAVVSVVLVYSVFLMLYMLNDQIQSDEDIERYLGLSVLGEIPNANAGKKGHYGYYKAYGAGKRTGKREEKRDEDNNVKASGEK